MRDTAARAIADGPGSRIVPTANVTVIIPVHNRPAALERALGSVFAQSLAVREIIVVDDASVPPLDLAALERRDPRIRGFRLSENQGAAVARNLGISVATCDWLAFLDSDDRWYPHKIARQIAHAESSSEQRKILIASNVLVRATGKPDRPYNRSLPKKPWSEWILVSGCTLQTSSLMIARQDARALGFDESLARHQDWDFCLRYLGQDADLIYNDECLVIYDGNTDKPRISSSRAYTDTISWLERSGDLLSGYARLSYYARAVFPAELRENPLAAVIRLASFAFSFPAGPALLAYTVTRGAMRRLFRLSRMPARPTPILGMDQAEAAGPRAPLKREK